ncbi:MAG: dipeptidase PepE [Gammaproteobacteria bacterium]|nr:dipeptidase PepE [Gammaproteobacteria bacterium]
MNALLLSASREGNTEYLQHTLPFISQFLSLTTETKAHIDIVFVPFAGVTINYDEYTKKVSDALANLPVNIRGLHRFDDPQQAISAADVIMVGGGNTFELLNQLYQQDLLQLIQDKVTSGCKYIGWSAGSNIAGKSIRTTNDMPIVQPQSFDALNIVPFQLNPHYTEYKAPAHNGETREMRINEFMTLNPSDIVVGIEEGSALQLSGNSLTLLGSKPAYIFRNGNKTVVNDNVDLSELLANKV